MKHILKKAPKNQGAPEYSDSRRNGRGLHHAHPSHFLPMPPCQKLRSRSCSSSPASRHDAFRGKAARPAMEAAFSEAERVTLSDPPRRRKRSSCPWPHCNLRQILHAFHVGDEGSHFAAGSAGQLAGGFHSAINDLGRQFGSSPSSLRCQWLSGRESAPRRRRERCLLPPQRG